MKAELLTTAEAGKRLGVSARTVQRAVRDGLLRAKMGGIMGTPQYFQWMDMDGNVLGTTEMTVKPEDFSAVGMFYDPEDTAKIKKHLLNVQYNAPVPDISGFTYYPRPKLEQFLADVPEDIARRLRAKGITGSLPSLP